MTDFFHSFGDEHAVSPVIGVMLMLVVVIIIAAVVSGYAGGLIGVNDRKAPSLVMDVKIVNMGSWVGSGFFATVTAVSGPISTKDLKIVTSWTAARSADNSFKSISGGNTTNPSVINVFALGDPANPVSLTAPFGTGPGINGSATIGSIDTHPTRFSSPFQQFGNYSLMSGTTLTAPPCGAASLDHIGGTWTSGNSPSAANGYGVDSMFTYTPQGTTYLDPVSAVLGPHWESLKAGDKVNVKVIYIPTGTVIYQKDIPVTEG